MRDGESLKLQPAIFVALVGWIQKFRDSGRGDWGILIVRPRIVEMIAIIESPASKKRHQFGQPTVLKLGHVPGGARPPLPSDIRGGSIQPSRTMLEMTKLFRTKSHGIQKSLGNLAIKSVLGCRRG